VHVCGARRADPRSAATWPQAGRCRHSRPARSWRGGDTARRRVQWIAPGACAAWAARATGRYPGDARLTFRN